jgi:hypothetical protein
LEVVVVLVLVQVLASDGSERLRREMAAAPLGVSTLVEDIAASIPCFPFDGRE